MPISTEALAQARLAESACARTLAGRPDLAPLLSADSLAVLRAQADAGACQARFALNSTAQAWRPPGAAGVVFDTLVHARAQALGARWLPGIGRNLAALPVAPGLGRVCHWAYGIFLQQPVPDCPPSLALALARPALHLALPLEFAQAAREVSLALVQDEQIAPVLQASASASRSSEDQAAGPDNAQADPEGTPQAEATADDDSAPGVMPPPLPQALQDDYRIYTRQHDREIMPQHLATPEQLAVWRARLDTELLPHRRLMARLAHRLQRLLLARMRSQWFMDQEEGALDPSRLARLVADPSRAEIFRQEEDGPFRRTAVTLLLDNSGSMRGRPILVTALVADILAHALEKCGIKVEVLGFTTSDKTGGAPAQAWRTASSPAQPGRLCALRHIVYKAMDTPWRRARLGLGLMLKDDLLQENVDGEALAWAAQRLSARPEPRRVLIVVSDGAPMDKATLAANDRNYLERHLHQVVAWLGQNSDIELHALGIGHPVHRYYPDALSLRNVDEFGSVLVEKLGTWLS